MGEAPWCTRPACSCGRDARTTKPARSPCGAGVSPAKTSIHTPPPGSRDGCPTRLIRSLCGVRIRHRLGGLFQAPFQNLESSLEDGVFGCIGVGRLDRLIRFDAVAVNRFIV